MFRQERGDSRKQGHQDFIEWLEYHRHEEIKNLLIQKVAIQEQVEKLLQEDQTKVLQKLDGIEQIVLDVATKMDGMAQFAAAFEPTISLHINESVRSALYDKAVQNKSCRVEWDPVIKCLPDWEDSVLELERIGDIDIAHVLGSRSGIHCRLKPKFILREHQKRTGTRTAELLKNALKTVKEKRQCTENELAQILNIPLLIAETCLKEMGKQKHLLLSQTSGGTIGIAM